MTERAGEANGQGCDQDRVKGEVTRVRMLTFAAVITLGLMMVTSLAGRKGRLLVDGEWGCTACLWMRYGDVQQV